MISKFPFQSTLPTWGATGEMMDAKEFVVFQSTLPTWGATSAFGIIEFSRM